MLPFTKRPGHGDDLEEVMTKDDIVMKPTSVAPPPQSKRPGMRAFALSVSDDEMTTLMPTKSLGNGVPIAAPSRPASIPAPSRPPMSAHPVRADLIADDDDDGRTVVRDTSKSSSKRAGSGHPKMGMPTSPTTISPAAVIKASLESARTNGRRADLMPPPPSDLIDDLADRYPAEPPQRTAVLGQGGPAASGPHAAISAHSMPVQALQPMGYGNAPMSAPPPPPSHPYSVQGVQAYGSMPPPSMPPPSMPPPSMPAHFMVPHAPYSDGRMDPPGTSVTSRVKAGGRPASSWAAALLVFGLFVGVGTVAVMEGSADALVETSASFVDPSRAAGATGVSTPEQTEVPPTPSPVPVAVEESKVAVPPVTVPSINEPPAAAAGPVPAVASATGITEASAKPAEAPKPEPAPAPKMATAPAPKAVAGPTPKGGPPPPPKGVGAPPAPKPAPPPPPAPKVAAAPPKPKPAPAPKPAAKSGGDSDLDAETKRALEALQKSQLESSF
jgi:hypothetical protein